MLQRAKSSLGSQLTLWRNHPHLLLIPALVLAACVVGGVLGTHYAIQSAVNNARYRCHYTHTHTQILLRPLVPVLCGLLTVTSHFKIVCVLRRQTATWSATVQVRAGQITDTGLQAVLRGTYSVVHPPEPLQLANHTALA